MTGSFKETAGNLNVPGNVQGSLSPAEQAAARVMESIFGTGSGDGAEEAFAAEVRAVVAAVRGPLYREVADVLDKLVGSAPLHTLDGLIYATNELAKMAAERQAEGSTE